MQSSEQTHMQRRCVSCAQTRKSIGTKYAANLHHALLRHSLRRGAHSRHLSHSHLSRHLHPHSWHALLLSHHHLRLLLLHLHLLLLLLLLLLHGWLHWHCVESLLHWLLHLIWNPSNT